MVLGCEHPGDWLGISEAMTYVGTQALRYENTVGYFALTGEYNFRLMEKSDREGFIEDSPFRGFMQIAKQCRNFANDSMMQVRQALVDYDRNLQASENDSLPSTVGGSFEALETGIKATNSARAEATRIAKGLQSCAQETGERH